MSSTGLNSSSASEFPGGAACPACGARARRGGARFCATCGRGLDDEGYVPADSVRASYHFERERAGVRGRPTTVSEWRGSRRVGTRGGAASAGRENGALKTAMACATYALVPYLGIVFCPGALLSGVVAYARARRAPYAASRRDALLSIVLGLLILAVQLFLWWLLYKVPEWSRRP